MGQQQMELLESRVTEMLKRVKSLRSEKAQLQEQIGKQASTLSQLLEERRLVRNRVEKLLGTINHVSGEEGK
jgi:predicted nuclease with TOPRIM domain